MTGYTRASFAPRARAAEAWPAWPHDPTSYTPNWQTYQVSFDKPGNQHVTVLWNGDSQPQTVQIPKTGTAARLVDRRGGVRPAQDNQDGWVVDLPGATAHFATDPAGYAFIGGDPLLLIEDNGTSETGAQTPSVTQPSSTPSLTQPSSMASVAQPSTPSVGQPSSTPSVGQPSSTVQAPRVTPPFGAPTAMPSTGVGQDPRLAASPSPGSPPSPASGSQPVRAGQAADFTLSTLTNGLSQPSSVSVQQWHTDRAPEPKNARSLPLQVTLPSTVQPGQAATVHVDTTGADPGTYSVTIVATSGSTSRTADLVLTLT
jgi:hypothetical protein